MLHEYWWEGDTTYSHDFELWSEWLFQYYKELLLGKDIEISDLLCKLEQRRLTLKYDIKR